MICNPLKTHPDEFVRFDAKLMRGAKLLELDYTPFYFPVLPNSKDPDTLALWKRAPNKSHCCDAPWIKEKKWVCSKCKITSQGSWKNPSARLTRDEALARLKAGGNVGIAARSYDPLVIMDIDTKRYIAQMPVNTLTTISRTRLGLHGFGFNLKGDMKFNMPTDTFGEIRSCDEYVVCAGSYVPTTRDNLQKKVDEGSIDPSDVDVILTDPLCGVYSVRDETPVRLLTPDELPFFFKERKKTVEKEANERPAGVRAECKGTLHIPDGKKHPLHSITFREILGGWNDRMPHPLHDSTTGTNFAVSTEYLAICWRHCVSLTPVQYLAVKAGWCSCDEAGNAIRHSKAGKSKVTGNYDAYLAAFRQAVKDGILSSDCTPPKRHLEVNNPAVQDVVREVKRLNNLTPYDVVVYEL